MHLERIALYYLTVPAAILLATFINPLLAVPAILSLAIYLLVTREPLEPNISPNLWPLVVLACLWTWSTGVLPPFSEPWDWIKHYAIFNLLIEKSWPPTFDGLVLRYSAAWYVLPSLAGKISYDLLRWAIFLWTAFGLWLGLSLGLRQIEPSWRLLAAGLVFLLFSGSDFLGVMMLGTANPLHMEWWAKFASISSVTVNIMWVPQHFVAGSLATALFVSSPAFFARNAALIVFTTALWSPFAAFGLLSFLLLLLTQQGGLCGFLTRQNVVIGIGFGIPTLIFLFSSTGNIPMEFVWSRPDFRWWIWSLFCVLEFGLIVGALLWAGQITKTEAAIVGGFLLILTLLRVGNFSDLTMRGSIPALCFLGFRLTDAVAHGVPRALPLVVLLLLGMPTPATEFIRSRISNRIVDPSTIRLGDKIKVWPITPEQYLAPRSWIFRR
jgi:hypothetical protein